VEAREAQEMNLDQTLLDILACPECKVRVKLEEGRLVCQQCGRRYRIEDGIPIMLVDEAEPPAAGWQRGEE
jgi:uncharacterized protein YbaR (Trm112 family)